MSAKRNAVIIFIVALYALLAGYLISTISFTGRLGIGLFYHEYRFLRSWWKDSLLVFIVLIVLYAIHSMLRQRAGRSVHNIISAVSLILAIAGLCFSYSDFRHTLSHRWLGEPFHVGVYLFWLGWIGVVLLTFRKPGMELPADTIEP